MSHCLGWKLTGASVVENNLVITYTDCGQAGSASVDLSGITATSVCYLDRLEMGKMSVVSTDPGTIGSQPIVPVTQLADSEIIDAVAWLGTAGSTDTVFEVYSISALGAGTLLDEFTIPSGDVKLDLSTLVGATIPQGGGMSMMVTTGSDALDLNVSVWFAVCTDITPPPDPN